MPQTGSLFFQEGASEVFRRVAIRCLATRAPFEEPAIRDLLAEGDPTVVRGCHRWLDTSYNFGERAIDHGLARAEGPVKAIHVHPYWSSRTTPQKRRIDHLVEVGLVPSDLLDLIAAHADVRHPGDPVRSSTPWLALARRAVALRYRWRERRMVRAAAGLGLRP